MDLRQWDARYRSRASEDLHSPATELVIQTANKLTPGRALDLACGTGRNAIWLARQGWQVTAVDGAPEAIGILRERALEAGVAVHAEVANLQTGEYRIAPAAWDLITICYYLQRDLISSAMLGLRPGGLLLVIVHITEDGEEPTDHRLRPGELADYFDACEILHSYEGKPNDPAHRRAVAEIVVRC